MAASAATGLLWAVLAVPALAGPPTVNGLFYGNGDNQRYPSAPYATSIGGSKLYVTLIDGILYVALVVDRFVNDNMFDVQQKGGQQPYMNSGGWGSHRTARRLVDSEFAEFNLIVGPENNRETFNWKQGYAGQPGFDKDNKNNTNATWVSDTTVSGGEGTPPPGLESASSLMWNMNNYATKLAEGTNTWIMPGNNTREWKSPFDPSDPNDVTEVDGYPATGQLTYSSTYEWEWSMVYEWSVDMTQFGESPVFVVTGASHHSPAKNGPEDDEFPNQEDPKDPQTPLMDFGDLPAPYPTLLSNDGARHVIDLNGARLGASLDSEPDGQPHPLALGDADDEDGVELLTPLIPGQEATFRVHIGAPGYLSAFIDWNGDGTLDGVTIQGVDAGNPATVATGTLADTHFSEPGFYEFTVLVPQNAEGMMPARFRITNGDGQGGASPTGEASSGEVEDHIFLSSIGDYVWADVNQNGIQDQDEGGVEGVTVNLLDADGDVVATTTTDANGFYEFTGLFGGDYRVEFVLPEGYVEFTTKGAGSDPTVDSNANPDGRTDTFTLAPNQVRSDIDAGLVPEGAPPTAVVLGEFELEVMEVTQLLRALGAGDADNAGLLALLQTWDPGAAAALAGAGRDQLSSALVDHLDSDGDGRVAVLRWETLEELGTMGFYVDRRDGRDWTRINNTMLPAMVGAHWGGEYWLADPGARPGGSYQYRLIEIEARGTTQEYGPFDLRMGGQ